MFSTVGKFRGLLLLLILAVSQLNAAAPQELAKAINSLLTIPPSPATQKVYQLLNSTPSTEAFLSAVSQRMPASCSATLERCSKLVKPQEASTETDPLFIGTVDTAFLNTPSSILELFLEMPSEELRVNLQKFVETEDTLFFSLVYQLVNRHPDTYSLLKTNSLITTKTKSNLSLIKASLIPFTLLFTGGVFALVGQNVYKEHFTPADPEAPLTVPVEKNTPPLTSPETKKITPPAPAPLQIKDLKPGTYKMLTEGSEIGLWLHNSKVTRSDYFHNDKLGFKIMIQPPDGNEGIEYLFLSDSDSESYHPNDVRLPETERRNNTMGSLKITSLESFEIHPKRKTPETPILKFQLKKE